MKLKLSILDAKTHALSTIHAVKPPFLPSAPELQDCSLIKLQPTCQERSEQLEMSTEHLAAFSVVTVLNLDKKV